MLRRITRKLNDGTVGAVVARGSIISFIIKILGTGTAFALQILLARILGITQYGIYVYVLTWINILALLSTLGFENTLVRFIAIYKAERLWPLMRGLMRTATRTVLLTAFISACILALLNWPLQDDPHYVNSATFIVAALLLPFLGLAAIGQAALRGIKDIIRSQVPIQVIYPSVIIAGTFLWLAIYKKIDAHLAMSINVFAAFITTSLIFWWLYKKLPIETRNIAPETNYKQWFQMALPMLLLSGMNVILSQTDIIMIGILSGPDAAGIYGAASRVSSLAAFGLTAVSAILAPVIAELFSTGKRESLQKILTQSARGIFIFTAIISGALLMSGSWILNLFGNGFTEGYTPLAILLSGQLVNAIAGPVGFVMTMTGHHQQAAWIIGISAASNILLNIILIPLYGIAGAAIATAITMIAWNIAMLIYVRFQLRLDTTIGGNLV